MPGTAPDSVDLPPTLLTALQSVRQASVPPLYIRARGDSERPCGLLKVLWPFSDVSGIYTQNCGARIMLPPQ